MLAGTGMLVAGSGIIGTSAAFGDSVTATSNFRVITAEDLRVRAGQAFEDDGSVSDDPNKNYEEQFVAYEETADSMFFDNAGGLNNISKDEIPVATVNSRDENNNEDLVIETAISLDNNDNKIVFEDILEIKNLGTSSKNVGISYDREQDQYGDDVNVGGDHDNELTGLDIQSIYRFIDDNDSRISPDEGQVGIETVDDPENFVEIAPNETHPIHLEIDLDNWGNILVQSEPKEHILQEAELDDPFEGSIDTVDMLDGITFGTEEEQSKSTTHLPQ